MTAPLEGILVVDFSQFLAGPYASLRLMDMGARVIKVENPEGGDLCRRLYLSDTRIGEDSTLFHAINRGKESIALDLKSPAGIEAAGRLIAKADVMIQNFRPGVIERLGLGYGAVKELKPGIVYGSISGYGDEGEWADLPGQDLLAQARSGIMWLSGNAAQGPVPAGLPIADISAGANLAQGILGALFRHAKTGQGALVETSLLESLVDMQFEFFTTYLNNGQKPPERAQNGSAHGYLPAPYGIYETADGYLALAMTPLDRFAAVLGLADLSEIVSGSGAAFGKKDRIREILQRHFRSKSAAAWETLLSTKGIWCAKVLTWEDLMATEVFSALGMVSAASGEKSNRSPLLRTPIRFDGYRASATTVGPELDSDASNIRKEFGF